MVVETLLSKAIDNFNIAEIIMNNINDDNESLLNQVAYHLQQTLELSLKYELEMNGVEYTKTHDIEQLIKIGKDNNVELTLSEYIVDHAEMFSAWEAKSRYVLGYLVERTKIEKSIIELRKHIKKLVKKYS